MKDIQIRKEEVTLSLYADDVIFHVENPREPTYKLIELINEFGPVAGYRKQLCFCTQTMKH